MLSLELYRTTLAEGIYEPGIVVEDIYELDELGLAASMDVVNLGPVLRFCISKLGLELAKLYLEIGNLIVLRLLVVDLGLLDVSGKDCKSSRDTKCN